MPATHSGEPSRGTGDRLVMSASPGGQAARGRTRVLAQRLMLTVLTGTAMVLLSAPARTVAETRVMLAPYGETAQVGALFSLTAPDQLGMHFCTGSVVDSAAGDLVITAAHCVLGHTAGQMAFVPDYGSGRYPDGIWTVTRVIVDRYWQSAQDPDDDFAFLTVHRTGSSQSLESLTGAEAIAVGVPAGKHVEVAGYPDTADAMVSCDNTAHAFSATQFRFSCTGFSDGTSGGPLLADVSPADGLDTVIGVIGGYEQGGSTASVSYAARFGGQLGALYQQALAISGHR
jgi:V8-like Glu-specific endopeptidase